MFQFVPGAGLMVGCIVVLQLLEFLGSHHLSDDIPSIQYVLVPCIFLPSLGHFHIRFVNGVFLTIFRLGQHGAFKM